MKKTFTFIPLFFAAGILFTACKHEKAESALPSANAPIAVRLLKPEKNAHNYELHLSAQFKTEDEALLSFKTGGIINNIYVKEGDHVRQGQVLATLDLTEISAQVTQAQLSYEKYQRD